MDKLPLTLLGYFGALVPVAQAAETFSSLPPPPRIASGQSAQQYMLTLVINQADGGPVVPVLRSGDRFWVRSADLALAGLPTDGLDAPLTDVSTLAGVTTRYDRPRQRLMLTVPAHRLPSQSFSLGRETERYPARISPGALLNYDVYATRIDNGDLHASMWNELRGFSGAGHFSLDGVFQQRLAGTQDAQRGYLRYDTYWARLDEDSAWRWIVGDTVTDALGWTSSVRFGGVQLTRDFSLRPDIITYPLPAFAGQTAVPTTVDMFVNGYRAGGASVQPGPYSLTNIPFINGAGEATIVTTDPVGRQIITTAPFYVTSTLLKPGLADYSLAAGALRRQYGVSNFDYGSPMANGSYRRGITDWLTLEGHGEAAQTLALGGAGSVVKLGRAGVVNGSWTQSRLDRDRGHQHAWGYQYNNRAVNAGMQHTWRSPHFGNLAIYENNAHRLPGAIGTLSRSSRQYFAGATLNRYGSVGAALVAINSPGGERTRLWNFTWSKTLIQDVSLFVSTSYDKQQHEVSGAISLSVPFGSGGSAAVSLERDRPGGIAQRLTVSKAMPNQGGISWDLSYARQQQQHDYRQAQLNWRNRFFETAGGFYGINEQYMHWADINGALVLMDGQCLAVNQLNNAFVLVKTGYPDIQVRYENQPAGITNNDGYLLIPNVTAFYPAKYDIDIVNLPANLTAPEVEQRLAVPGQSGYLLHFPIEPLRAASVVIYDGQGQPLPAGTQILRDGQPTQYLGWDGIAWLDRLQTENPLRAVTPEGKRCTTHLTLPGGVPRALHTYGPLICSPSGPS